MIWEDVQEMIKGKNLKYAAVAYLKVLFQHSPGTTE
jgi:hypothetical protein